MTCRLFGHRYRFHSEAVTLTWVCERCGSVGGRKDYATAAQARGYAAAFDREDRDDVGRRAPLLGLFPLRLLHFVRSLRGTGSSEPH